MGWFGVLLWKTMFASWLKIGRNPSHFTKTSNAHCNWRPSVMINLKNTLQILHVYVRPRPFLFMCSNFSCQGRGGLVVDIGERLERLQPPSRWLLPLQYAWRQERAIKDIIYCPATRGLSDGLLLSLFRCATISRNHMAHTFLVG